MANYHTGRTFVLQNGDCQLNFCLILLQLHFIYAVKLSGGERDLSLISKLFLFGAASLQRSPPIKDRLAVVPHLMLSSFRGPE